MPPGTEVALRRRYGLANASIAWVRLRPLAQIAGLGGGYLRSADGRFVIFARRYRAGDRSRREYHVAFSTLEYLDGATYATGGKHRTLYDGQSLEKAKAAAS